MGSSLLASSVHGIFQARTMECVAISSFRGFFWPRDWTDASCISCIGRWISYHCVPQEAPVPWQINWLFYEEALLFYQHWFDLFHVSQNCFIPRQWCSFVRNIQHPVKMARTSMRNCLGWSLANVAFNTCLHYKETWNDLPRWFFFSSMKDRTRDFGTIQQIMRLAKRDRRTQLGIRQGSSLTLPLKGIKLN